MACDALYLLRSSFHLWSTVTYSARHASSETTILSDLDLASGKRREALVTFRLQRTLVAKLPGEEDPAAGRGRIVNQARL